MQRALALMIGLMPFAASLAAAELPNVVWITSEDNGPHLGCYGDAYATTPNLDSLAARGMIYTNASSNAPVCAPARTAIISGLYPPSTGSEHMRSLVRLPADFPMFPQLLREVGYYTTNNVKEDYNLAKPGRVWDESSRRAHWKHRGEGQPFFAVFNHTVSHESRIRDEIRDSDRIHDPAQVRVPSYHPDVPEVRRDWAQYYDRITMMDRAVGANLRELEEAGLAEETIIFYYGDHGSGMPRSKRWPYNSGLHVPLIVYFPSKWRHLAPRDYEPEGASDRLVSFIDLAPTLLSLAGIEPPEWMQGSAFAGEYESEEPEFSHGFRGRMDERYDLVRSVRDKRYLYIRNYMPHRIYGQHLEFMFETPTTRVWHQLYGQGELDEVQARFWQPKPVEELYDLWHDSDEVRNLADSTKHTEVLARMRKAQRKWASRIRDVGFLSEGEMHARSQGTTPYDMARDPQRYDFEAIFAAAELASSMRPDDLPGIVTLLESPDSGVRYWGAVGLLAHEEAGVEEGYTELVAALEDESPMVRITAAEALGRFGGDQHARAVLDVLLAHASPEQDVYLVLAAWNGIDYLGERARPALATLKALSAEPENAPQRVRGNVGKLKRHVLAKLQ